MNESKNILLTTFRERNKTDPTSNENEEKSRKFTWRKGKSFYQFAAVFSVGLVSMGFSVFEHWTSPALPHLRSKESGFSITAAQSSLVLSLFSIGTAIGTPIFPPLANKFGVKYCLIFFSIPPIIACLMIYFAKNVTIIYIARFICGIGYGPNYIAQLMYIGEIAEKKIRGTLMFITRMFYPLGTIFVLTLGAFASYDSMNLTIIAIPVLFIVTFSFMPESPYFYLKSRRYSDAYKSLTKFRGMEDTHFLQNEIDRMREAMNDDDQDLNGKNALVKLFSDTRQRRAFTIVTIVQTGFVLSGTRLFASIGQDIFSFTDSFLSSRYVYLIIMVIVLIFCLPTARFVDNYGRKLTLLVSSLISSGSLVIMGIYFFVKIYYRIDVTSFAWIPIVLMIVFEVSCLSGLYTVTSLLIGELFSTQVKATALTIQIIIKEILVFLTKFSYDKLIVTIDVYGIFWMYAALNFGFSFIGFLILPETKGKTLEEIQILLSRRRNRR